MTGKPIGTIVLAVAGLALCPAASADEVVHFRNGAEMTVRSHTVAGDMVKLDLGGGSFISFPLSMVDRVASAGKDVYVNPVYHPVNQAVGGTDRVSGAVIPVQDLSISGIAGANAGFHPRPGTGAGQGTMLGVPTSGVLPEDRYQRQNGVTTVPAGPNRSLRRVVLPTLDTTMPAPTTGQGLIQPNESTPVRQFPHVMAIPSTQPPASPPPAPTSDGTTEAGTPPQSN